ncbi:ATP-binding protein [Candidatus Leptofilum sp.]|uniref:ATP-binding response regulator n=1 Tax=Candidatus Leptofilum sp. TaxID=3241576 RepID=UPI003B58D590
MATLLIVDDNDRNRYLLEALLRGNGYKVNSAAHGIEALEMAQRDPPDMAISDILMPEMDGFALCRRWQEDEQLRQIPFLFYTATYTDPKDEAFALSLGAHQFIIKPTEPHLLLELLQETLTAHKSGHLQNRQPTAAEETSYFRMYNEALVRKLEDKMVQVEHANQQLNMLYRVSTSLASIQTPDELVAHALNTVVEATGYTHANYFSYDDEAKQFHLLEAVGHPQETVSQFQQQLVFELGEARGLVGLVGQARKPLIVSDTDADARWLRVDETIQSALFLPVSYEDQLLGVVSFLSTKKDAFDDENVRVITTLVNNVAIAVNNAHLYQAQQQYANRLEAEVAARTEELRTALEKAQETDRLKSQFVSDMNHELRTPLSNIKLYLTLLEQGRKENRPHYMEVLNRESERLQYLIEDMLDLSLLDTGKTAANLGPTDLNQLIVMLVLDRSELAQDKGLSLDFEPTGMLPQVQADPQMLFQALANLLANAINYTPSGGAITVQTGTAVTQKEPWVVARIIDTGPGIAEDEQAKIFDRFYRGKISRASGVSGTGLGLAICREILDRHGGRLTVDSTPGQGSTFTVWLRCAAISEK